MKIAWFLIGLAVAQPTWAEDATEPAVLAPRPVVSEIVSYQSGKQTSFVGVVAARIEADLGFPLIGTIAERPVDAGDQLAKGDVIAKLDPEELDADVRAAEAGVAVARAQLRSAEDAWTRAKELARRGVDSATQVEDTERALAAARARLEQNEAALARAQDMFGFATLVAPHDGIITQVFAESGATLTAGEPVVRLAGTGEREIIMDLGEQDVAGLDVGTTFDATLVASTDIVAQATLSRIDPVTERTTRTRRLHLTLIDPPNGFRLGALVRITASNAVEGSVSLDYNALLDPDGTPAVWIVDRTTNTVSRREVELGERFGPRISVLSGLTSGDEVITKGIHSIKDGQTVGLRVTP